MHEWVVFHIFCYLRFIWLHSSFGSLCVTWIFDRFGKLICISLIQTHAQWLLENKKFEHSSQQKYGENLCRIRWKTSIDPTEEDKLAIATFAVEEWYKEYFNYSTVSHDWNGNIIHDEQIGHFLQVCEKKYLRIIFS